MAVNLSPYCVVSAEELEEFVWAAPTDMATEDKDVLYRIANAVSEAIENYIKRYVIQRADITEYHDGGGEEIFLKHYPIVNISSVHEDGELLDAPTERGAGDGDYDYYPDMGIIYKTSGDFTSGRQKVKIVYTAGIAADVTTVPADIKQAALLWIKQLHQSDVENYSMIITATTTVRPSRIPPAAAALLAPYRKVNAR